MSISISSSSNDYNLGNFKVDQITKNEEKIVLEDKQSERKFLLEILNEKILKVIRISYTDEATKNELINNLRDNQKNAKQISQKWQVILK